MINNFPDKKGTFSNFDIGLSICKTQEGASNKCKCLCEIFFIFIFSDFTCNFTL